MYDTDTNQNRSLYFAIVEWNRVPDGDGEGVGEPVLPWEDKFDEVSRTFQLRLGSGVRRFPRIRLRLWTGRVYLIQDVYVASSKTHILRQTNRRTLFRQTNRNYGSVGYQIRTGVE